MTGKQEATEDVCVADLQDPCGKVKAALPESQSPAVQGHTLRSASDAETPIVVGSAGLSITSFARRAMANEVIQGDERDT